MSQSGESSASTSGTSIPGFTLRAATERDAGVILGFIRELAEFEKLSHEVVATEEILRSSLFGQRKVAEVILGYFEGKPVGFALFFHSFSTFLGQPGIYLEDLFIQPAMRSLGFGREMLAHLARLAVERGCGRLEWSVLDWNREAIRFYEKLGAKAMSDWTMFRLTGDALKLFAGRN